MGYQLLAQSGHRARYTAGAGGPGTFVDLLTDPALPRGLNGAGTIHHVAFRIADAAAEDLAREQLLKDGLHVSPPIDRAYFEIATDGPGFAIDEPLDQLGTILGLPPHLEPYRAQIEAALPKLD
jgi:glyoxalase family protein